MKLITEDPCSARAHLRPQMVHSRIEGANPTPESSSSKIIV